jgi:four helix bundle protein
MKESILFDKSCELCGMILDLTDNLEKIGQKNISKQLERAVTSISANLSEANSSESANDFIHKLKVAIKESNETYFWLKLISKRNLLNVEKSILDLLDEVQRMLSKSISTASYNQEIKLQLKKKPPTY